MMRMAAQGDDADGPVLYQATISAHRDVIRGLGELDIDLLPGTEVTEGTQASFEALLRPPQVEALVAAGATVTLKRTIDPVLPTDELEAVADPLERLRALEPYREDRG